MVTLFNFQGSVASELSFSSFSILSHRLRFVKSFFKIFSIFIFELVFRDFSATAYLFYHIEFRLSSFIFDFFKSFFRLPRFQTFTNLRSIPVCRAAFSFALGLSLCDSLSIISYLIGFVKSFFHVFSTFFNFINSSSEYSFIYRKGVLKFHPFLAIRHIHRSGRRFSHYIAQDSCSTAMRSENHQLFYHPDL